VLTVVVLGSGNGLPGARRDTHGLALRTGESLTVVDFPGALVHKLAREGLCATSIDRLVLTHDHVDHIYGLPHLLHALAIAGDDRPRPLFAPGEALSTVAALVSTLALDRPGYPRLQLESVPVDRAADVLDEDLRIRSVGARHSRPTLALRCTGADGGDLGLSSDTRPSRAIAGLCEGVGMLLHDCGGLHRDRADFGEHHASARQAGEIAHQAAAGELRLTHLPDVDEQAEEDLVAEARREFGGAVAVARDGERYELG
jgi:ribonuclease Z